MQVRLTGQRESSDGVRVRLKAEAEAHAHHRAEEAHVCKGTSPSSLSSSSSTAATVLS
eukprot:CAMPEP_0182556936 /NCGR_PEP_ID=MMETSP1324-20130603/1045_1 /TAXON_ID=236786 /ORGANISM="Florenciella sp., Strain RCC1587" /LENGTH=57 /DNA_ID=CAMNT_0024768913 /DNA_START=322 /DNA_END=492 /DNA_ORIENTATION=-